MSTLHRIGRVQIRMFYDHNPPHFHIWTPDSEVQVSLRDLTLLRGGPMHKGDYELAMEWARANIDFLWQEWNRRNG